MKRLILKFGGTSVGNIDKIQKVANLIKKKHDESNEIIIVVSAISGFTDELIKKSQLISKNFDLARLCSFVLVLNSFPTSPQSNSSYSANACFE